MSNKKNGRINPNDFNKPLILGVFGLIMILLSVSGEKGLVAWVLATGLLCLAGAMLIWLIEAKFIRFWNRYDE